MAAIHPEDEVRRWVARLQPLGPVRARAMFGGHGLFLDDRMVGLVAAGVLSVRVDAVTEPAFRRAGAAPFVYDGKGAPTVMPSWTVPADPETEPGQWLSFAALGLTAAARAASRRGRPGRSRRAPGSS